MVDGINLKQHFMVKLFITLLETIFTWNWKHKDKFIDALYFFRLDSKDLSSFLSQQTILTNISDKQTRIFTKENELVSEIVTYGSVQGFKYNTQIT